MQQPGEYIVDRFLPDMVRQACDNLGVEYRSFSGDWVFELSRANKTQRIVGYKFDINQAAAAAIAADKVAAYELLTAHGVSAVPHYLVRTKAGAYRVPDLLAESPCVIKPLTGTSGHAVRRCSSQQEAVAYMNQSGIEAWAVSPLLVIDREIRILLLDGAPLVVYEKVPTEPVNGLTMFNLGKGATPREYQADEQLLSQAVMAQAVLGLRVAAVDCVILAGGEYLVLEVNDGIMMEHYARASPSKRQLAADAYQRIIAAMMQNK